MAARYPSQTFELYQHPQWPVDSKAAYGEDDQSSVLDDHVLDATSPTDDSRRAAAVKTEEPYQPADNMWHDRSHELAGPAARHFSHPNIAYQATPQQPYMRIDPSYAAAYTQSQPWPMSVSSGTSTPTPLFISPGYGTSQAMSYPGGPVNFSHVQQHDPATAISMSPQSSQGGWPSSTSSESAEPSAHPLQSPSFRSTSPTSALRPDGVRKKNARFEIPKERNLHNIDAMIMATADEAEKKELKQQKRLLRNRQAALDSRQRKKTHTEKLELEKKHYTQKQQELEEGLQRAHEEIQRAQEEMMHQRQQFEVYIRQAEFDRDEAIRTKTIETGELRRMNNILKDAINDLHRRQLTSTVSNTTTTTAATSSSSSTNYTPDSYSFDNLGLDDTWDDDFLLDNDFKMEQPEPRQSTPKPQPKPVVEQKSADLPFSWNAFYMCLLFGAFIASNSNSSTTSAALQQSIPTLSDDYRAEAGNVLKAVLSSSPDTAQSLIPGASSFATPTPSGSALQPPSSSAASHLDTLHSTLTTPSHHQQLSHAFALSADSYNHLTTPDPDLQQFMHDRHSDHEITPQPSMTRLQQGYNNLRSETADIDRVLAGPTARRSLLWERIPEKVLRDFREMVGMVGNDV